MDKQQQAASAQRRYHSPIRQRQAEDTRRRILDAARALFRDEGYAGTTLDAVAAVADVSPKTVTAAFGSKRGLLAALLSPTAFGRSFQEVRHELVAASDPRRRLELAAKLAGRAYEALAPEFDLLRGANAVAPEVAAVARQIEARRRQNQTHLVAYLRDCGVLRGDLTPEEAVDVLWALTSYDVYRALVIECGWAPERYETWLADMLIQRLLTRVE